jgi:hypothetical protein
MSDDCTMVNATVPANSCAGGNQSVSTDCGPFSNDGMIFYNGKWTNGNIRAELCL